MAIRSLKSGSFSRSVQVGNAIILPGDYESIATVTVGAGGASSVSFTSIPSTYKHLQIRLISRAVNNVSTDDPYLRFNNDSATNYSWHRFWGTGASASSTAASTQAQIRYGYGTADASMSANIFTTGVIDILDYANTNKAKTIRSLIGADNNGSGNVDFISGAWYKNTSSVYDAIDRIDLFPFSGNWAQYSHFALYGIRG